MSGVGLTGLIKPLNDASFPVWEDINGLGGYRSEATNTARDNIPANFKKVGMCVYVQATGLTWQWSGSAWVAFGSGGGATQPGVYLVSPGAGTLAAAIAQAVTDGKTTAQFILAPGTYTGAVTISGSVNYSFALFGYCGIPAADVTGAVTWNISNNATIAWNGVNLTTPIFHDAGGGSSNVQWTWGAGALGDVVVNNTLVHSVQVSLVGPLFGSTQAAFSASCVAGALPVNGVVTANNAALTGAIACSSFRGNYVFLAGITIAAGENCILRNSESDPGTVFAFTASNKQLLVDETTATYTGGGQITTTGAGSTVLVYQNPALLVTGADSATGVYDFSIGVADSAVVRWPVLTHSFEIIIGEAGAANGKKIRFVFAATGTGHTMGLRDAGGQTINFPTLTDGTLDQVVLGSSNDTALWADVERIGGVWLCTAVGYAPHVRSNNVTNESGVSADNVTDALNVLNHRRPFKYSDFGLNGNVSEQTNIDISPNPAPAGLYRINVEASIAGGAAAGVFVISVTATPHNGTPVTYSMAPISAVGASTQQASWIISSDGSTKMVYNLHFTTPLSGTCVGYVQFANEILSLTSD